MHASRAVAGYVEQVNDMSGEQKKELLDQAHAYNQKLNTLPDRWHLTDEQMDEYNKTLDITGTGIDQTAQTADVNGDNVNTLSAYLVDTVIAGQTTPINLKKGTVTLEKKVQDWNDTEGKPANPAWSDSADHDLGDDVPFQLTGTLPANYDRSGSRARRARGA